MSNVKQKTGARNSTTYVLIDFENVQPKNLGLLESQSFQVFVFVGANQTKVPFELARALQALGKKAEYIKISGNGQNALDFHVAYYIGKLAAGEPGAQFHVISKDKGFDPLIKHLKDQRISVQRERDLAEIPQLRIPASTSSDEQIAAIVKNLAGRGHARPRKVKTLQNTIKNLFAAQLDEQELSSLVKELQKRKLIVVKENNVSYRLPQ